MLNEEKSIKEVLLSILASETALLADKIKSNDCDNYLQIIKTHRKMYTLIQEGVFIEEEKLVLEEPVKVEKNQLKQDVFYYFMLNKGQFIIEDFLEERIPYSEDYDDLFLDWLEKKASFLKNGMPANVYGAKLKQWQERNNDVHLEKEMPVIQVVQEDKEAYIHEGLKGIFKLQTYGGSVNSIVIPESIVRSLCLNEGDILSLLPDKYKTGHFPYRILIDEKAMEPVDSRIGLFDHAFVVKEEDKLVVYESANGTTLEDVCGIEGYKYEVYQTYIDKFDLKEGSIVSLKWVKDKVDATIRIAWAYPESDYESIEKTCVNKSIIKKINRSSEESSNSHTYDLSNQTILVLGGQVKWSNWRKIIETNKGRFEGYDNRGSNLTLLKSLVKDADVIMLAENMVSHNTFYHAKDLAKEYNKPIMKFNGTGNNALIIRLKEYYENHLLDEEIKEITCYDQLESAIETFQKDYNKEKNNPYFMELSLSIIQAYQKLNLNRKQKRDVEKKINKVITFLQDINQQLVSFS